MSVGWWKKVKIHKKYDYTCQDCGKKADIVDTDRLCKEYNLEHIPRLRSSYGFNQKYISFEVHHIIPKVKGGVDDSG